MDLGKRPRPDPGAARHQPPGTVDPEATRVVPPGGPPAAGHPGAPPGVPGAPARPGWPQPAVRTGGPPPATRSAGGIVAINLKYFAFRAVVFGAVLAAVLVMAGGDAWVLALALAVVFSGLASYPLAKRARRGVIDAVEARRSGPR